jgi:anti-sigma B factor antagonist
VTVLDITPFRLAVRPDRQRVVVEIAGELDCATAPRVRAQLSELRATGWTDVVLDVSGLEFVDSTGLATLLWAQRAAEREGWRIAIAGTCASLDRLVELSGLTALVARS